jgi:hypothetical protein
MDRRAPSASTSAVLLRDVKEDDLPIFFEQQLDPDVGSRFWARQGEPDASGEQVEGYMLKLSATEQRR